MPFPFRWLLWHLAHITKGLELFVLGEWIGHGEFDYESFFCHEGRDLDNVNDFSNKRNLIPLPNEICFTAEAIINENGVPNLDVKLIACLPIRT